MAYLPILPRVRDRVNRWLVGMAARGFVPARADIERACATRPEDLLPDGVFERDGQLMFICRSCDQATPLDIDVSEFDPEMAYCGGSSRCVP